MTELDKTLPPDPFSRRWLLVVILCMVPLFFLFVALGDPGRGRAAAICGAVGLTAVRACWNSRKHAWFWAIVVVMAALHVCIVLFIPWNNKSYPGFALLPVAIVDYGVVYGSLKIAEKIMMRSDGNSSTS